MDILITLLIGGIAGWLAGMIMKGRGFGIIGNVIVGMVGSFVGWIIFRFLGLSADGNWGFLVTATIGALIFLALTGMVRRPATI